MGIFKGSRPDITPVQIIAFVFAAIPYILVLVGVDLGEQKADALDNLKILALGLFGSDALIRIGRNYAAGKTAEAGSVTGDVPPEDVVDPDVPEPHLESAASPGVPPLPPEGVEKGY
jgi:hypothetical protein